MLLVRILADAAEGAIEAMTPTRWSARITGFLMGFLWAILAGIVLVRVLFGGH